MGGGGRNREVAYFKFRLIGEGLTREGGSTERGGLIEILRYYHDTIHSH